mmetsp:Transcript_25618/g.57602  ORF Transcript_25618/g.57602 Transcript_25618/m.57602 type:complete len:267 (-) Transcript_25618:335-1135(-)
MIEDVGCIVEDVRTLQLLLPVLDLFVGDLNLWRSRTNVASVRIASLVEGDLVVLGTGTRHTLDPLLVSSIRQAHRRLAGSRRLPHRLVEGVAGDGDSCPGPHGLAHVDGAMEGRAVGRTHDRFTPLASLPLPIVQTFRPAGAAIAQSVVLIAGDGDKLSLLDLPWRRNLVLLALVPHAAMLGRHVGRAVSDRGEVQRLRRGGDRRCCPASWRRGTRRGRTRREPWDWLAGDSLLKPPTIQAHRVLLPPLLPALRSIPIRSASAIPH